MATITQQLDQYLQSFQDRLKRVQILKGAAVLAAVALVVSVAGAYLAVRTGFSGEVIAGGRLLLVLSIAAIAVLLIVLPLKRLKAEFSRILERRVSAFSGRIETYNGLKDQANPFRALLAEDALEVARRHPAEREVARREFAWPAAATGLSIIIFLWLIVAGPGLLNYGLRHLWAGWAFSDLLPPQSIMVTPGDEAVRRGGSVKLLARMEGFEPPAASVHVRMGDNDWQQVDMLRTDRGFEFTFFSLREPVQYYVASAGIRSPGYEIQVVDLPDIDSLKLTYTYPEWTRRPPDTVEPGGDIQAISGTGVDLEVTTTAPLPGGVLVLNGENREMQTSPAGNSGTASFEINRDGQYYVAARVGRELVRLTDDYFIKVTDDGKPDIAFTRPGNDWSASAIEEVTLEVEASDDYALEGMELRYSVNGGEWQSVPLPVEGRRITADHVFFLEKMGAGEAPPADGAAANLAAGDLISYYAQAKDKEQTTSTDMYFIQVQPFDRRYTQSQQAGGAGGGQGGQQQEISQRQKEIIVSTWNLIREKSESGGAVPDKTRDNAVLLSDLQNTLSEQARTLADRTRARQLTSTDEQIARFVESVDNAVEAMKPASERLAAIDLEQAIQPEQEALQHLLRAEAVFTDMQVSFQQGQGGGGSSFRAGQDLADMFELEMDLNKNQYETGNSATPQSQSEQVDDAMRQLEELARRQEQLANNFRQQQNLTEAQRWQQEMLRREAEQVRERLERMEQSNSRQAQNEQQGQQGQQGEQGQQGQSGQPGQQVGTGGQSAGGAQRETRSETARRLESAIRAMDEIAEAMNGQADRERLQRAADEAQRQLEGARDEVAQNQQRSMQESFENMAAEASDLYEQQVGMERELQDAVRRALADRQQQRQATSGLTPQQEAELAAGKKAMTEKIQQLEQEIHTTAEQYKSQAREAVRELEQARDLITRSQVQERLYVAGEYIAYGAAPYVAGSESAVTQALSELRERLQRARAAAEGAEFDATDGLEETLAQTRALRRELERLSNAGGQEGDGTGQPGQESQAGQQGGQGQQPRQQSNGGRQARAGQGDGGAVGPDYNPWGGYINRGGNVDRDAWNRFGRDLSDTARAVRDVIPQLRDQDLSLEEINAIRELANRLEQELAFSGGDKNDQILQQESLSALSLLEQLELRLDAGARSGDPSNVRTTAAEAVSSEYEDAVAEYYRRLSREEE